MKKIEVFIFLLILLLGFLVRLYRFDNPVADWHSFRQSDTNAVSAIFVRDGIDLLYPRYFDISNVQSGLDNPQGDRFVEFPIYNALQAGLFGVLGELGLTLEQWGRLISIFATLSGTVFVFLLTKKYAGRIAGFMAAFFYLFLPFSIFYGRSILPDPSMTASIMGGIYFFDKWIEKKSKINPSTKLRTGNQKSKIWFDKLTILSNVEGHIKNQIFFALSILFTAFAFLLKPFALFFTLPIIYFALREFGLGLVKKWQIWLFAFLTLAPLLVWRWWIGQYPEGIPVSGWLFNGNGIRFRPAFFRWIFFERITKLILGYSGIIFAAVGTVEVLRRIKEKSSGLFLSFALSSLIYLLVIATGNVQHDYYQIAIIPTVSMFGGLGAAWLLGRLGRYGAVAVTVIIFAMFWFSWTQARDYFNINDRGMVEAAGAANKILPKDATVIAPYDGSTTFLNLIQRRGWPVFQKSIEELIESGAEYLVIANPTQSDFDGFGKTYKHVTSGSSYLILKLK